MVQRVEIRGVYFQQQCFIFLSEEVSDPIERMPKSLKMAKFLRQYQRISKSCASFPEKSAACFSVYTRVCNGTDAVEKHRSRIRQNLPENGAIRMLVITEKQYEAIDILLGSLSQADDSFQCEQLSIF